MKSLLKCSDPEEKCDILGYDASIICQWITEIDLPVIRHSVALTALCKVTFNCHVNVTNWMYFSDSRFYLICFQLLACHKNDEKNNENRFHLRISLAILLFLFLCFQKTVQYGLLWQGI